jgi:hypothetical protein
MISVTKQNIYVCLFCKETNVIERFALTYVSTASPEADIILGKAIKKDVPSNVAALFPQSNYIHQCRLELQQIRKCELSLMLKV